MTIKIIIKKNIFFYKFNITTIFNIMNHLFNIFLPRQSMVVVGHIKEVEPNTHSPYFSFYFFIWSSLPQNNYNFKLLFLYVSSTHICTYSL